MEFLKEILGDELFKQVETAVNAWNGNEANKDKLVKLANLSSGEYVSKGKYDAEVSTSQSKDAEIENYKNAIADLQKTSKNNEAIQQRISQLEEENERLKNEQKETEVYYAFDLLLRDAGVEDKDAREFLAYKYKKQLADEGKSLELDDNKRIKGGDDIVKSLQTTNPTSFKSEEGGDGYKPLDGNGLPKGGGGDSVTKEQFKKMTYEERVALKQKNEKLYQSLRG